ncbi:MAG: hypothetical protein BGO57_08570 [Sphingomonadales bacterium 63-6]|nr:MAG: hypothetical protein BGO57_08570 [Sphingomonadales bacterium 63-6]
MDSDLHHDFTSVLVLDVVAAMQRYRAEKTQANSRDLIRSIFAAVEGSVWLYRQHVTSIAKSIEAITREEELALAETAYLVNANGTVSEQMRFIPLPALIRLTTRIANRIDPRTETRFDIPGWESFQRAIAIRNRITHPKTKSDLLVSERDVDTCHAAFFWLLQLTESGMEAVVSAFRAYVEEMREIFEKLKAGDPEITALYHRAQMYLDE